MSSNVYNIEAERRRHAAERPLSATINEAKEEFKTFAGTRIAMLQSEMREKIDGVRASAPMLIVGGVILWTGWLALTAALICVISAAFSPSPYAAFFGCVIVGVVYAAVGGASLFFGLSRIKEQGLVPNRTLRVLKEDKVWLQNEARTQL
jgi:UDP:flavonoid glycosyltransferase YjiC (YdhE family)